MAPSECLGNLESMVNSVGKWLTAGSDTELALGRVFLPWVLPKPLQDQPLG